MFTAHGHRFETVTIARLVLLLGWTHVPAAAPDADGRVVGGCTWTVVRGGWIGGGDEDDWAPEYVERVEDCGTEVAYDEHHWVCAAGHENTSAEARQAEGWDYAEDAYDAAVIAKGGRTPVPMGPATYWDDREAAQIMAQI
jgi:hypothetical protein